MLRIISTALGIAVAAVLATALGAFDPAPAARPTDGKQRPEAPSLQIAPTAEALTFARIGADAGARTVAVTAYEKGRIRAVALDGVIAPAEDAIGLVNRLGYDAVKAAIDRAASVVEIDTNDLAIPVDLGAQHIAAGTNFREHAEEATVEGGPFLFPKYVRPTSARAPIPAGEALLDYEVELCMATMRPLAPSAMANGGLILCNDVTDRATLLRQIDPDNPESGIGFTSGKSAPGFLPVGNLFVVPRDMKAFSRGLVLQLSVNGQERQRAPVSHWIWDIDRIRVEAARLRDRSWAFESRTARLPIGADGAIPERTLILTGTPGGTVFKGVYPSAYASGALAWLAGGWARPIAAHVVESHIRTARESGGYLQRGDVVTIRADRMGTLENPVE